jgi:hypothetical protein
MVGSPRPGSTSVLAMRKSENSGRSASAQAVATPREDEPNSAHKRFLVATSLSGLLLLLALRHAYRRKVGFTLEQLLAGAPALEERLKAIS